jgi:hypothetical protein
MENKKVRQVLLWVPTSEGDIRKWYSRPNVLEIICTHVWKWKVRLIETILEMLAEGNKGE